MFEYTYYYKVYNTWSTEAFGPRPEGINHIYGQYCMQRETEYTEEEIQFGRNAITKAHVDTDPDVSPEDVVFITKEEYEANTGGDSKSISFAYNKDDE
jgi:hypothetical protein